jgi:hypothetical protein
MREAARGDGQGSVHSIQRLEFDVSAVGEPQPATHATMRVESNVVVFFFTFVSFDGAMEAEARANAQHQPRARFVMADADLQSGCASAPGSTLTLTTRGPENRSTSSAPGAGEERYSQRFSRRSSGFPRR